jgi:hypothetical protein
MFVTFPASLIMDWDTSVYLYSVSLKTALPILAVVYCVAWVVYARYFHPLAKYPRPVLASITRFWLIIDVAQGSSEKTQRFLHRIYG